MPMGSEEQDDGEMLAEREAEAEGPSPAEPAPPGLERCHRPIMRPWAPQRSATVWPGPCQRPGACYKLRVSAAPQASRGASALERVPRSSAGTGRFEEPDLGMTVTATLHPAPSPSMANGASGVLRGNDPFLRNHPAPGWGFGARLIGACHLSGHSGLSVGGHVAQVRLVRVNERQCRGCRHRRY